MRPKKRKDCFWGLHNDFHATPAEGLVIGATLKEQDIREICESLKPDYIQIDCKGHPGWASYPTALNNAMPRFKDDPLILWRRVTAEYGIGLYMHYSGVYDVKYCTEHPDECIMDADGNHTNFVRLDSKYWDELFIKQVSELVCKYHIDGLWIDGDCWAAKADYHPKVIRKFEEETGIRLNGCLPKTKQDPYFKEFLDYSRERYRRTLRRYVDILHAKYPQLQICSNWAFSDHMPEEVSANVDFLSGDLTPTQSFASARYAARMLSQYQMPWDLMAWNFRQQVYSSTGLVSKHPIQVMQEAAAVIATGGGFQDYVPQFNDGSPNMAQIRDLVGLSQFLKQRQPFCFQALPVSQVAVLVSTFDRYQEVLSPFSRRGAEKYLGLVSLLCDSGLSTQTVLESTLEKRGYEYPVIIVPELYCGLSEQTFDNLKNYVAGGGNLCIIGAKTAMLFAQRGFGFSAEPYGPCLDMVNNACLDNGHESRVSGSTKAPHYFTLDRKAFGLALGGCRISTSQPDAKVVGTLHASQRGEGAPFAGIFSFEKGTVSVIAIDLGTQYNAGAQYLHRALIKNTVLRQFSPVARIESAVGILEIVCLEKQGRLLLQLVNANGDHNNVSSLSEDQLPPVVDVEISVKCKKAPEKLLLQPGGKEIRFTRKEGRAYFQIPRIDIHNVVEIVY